MYYRVCRNLLSSANEKTLRIFKMKYTLIIDKNAKEEIIAIVHAPSSLTEQIENLVCSFDGMDYIIGYQDDEMQKLTFEEIECVTIIKRKVIAIDTNGNQYRIPDRLRDLEAVLPSYFIRINKSTLANEHRILKFNTAFSGGVDAVFKCGYREYVSRRCFSEIKRRYEGI
ncbi:MAG: LytTR family transcriptional regulator [Ruminococcaceae bacterium]|nr:LytTR family transcriptional regulator [Oscillospiraceae bacterium]